MGLVVDSPLLSSWYQVIMQGDPRLLPSVEIVEQRLLAVVFGTDLVFCADES